MSRRRRNTPEPTPQPPTPDTTVLERLALLEKQAAGEDVGPVADLHRHIQAEQARTTRPAGPGPVSHCPYCGIGDSDTGWRMASTSPNGWACATCSHVVCPPYVDGRRTLPNRRDLAGLLAAAHLGTEPIPWLVRFGARYGLAWEYATEPGTTPWAHVQNLGQWRKVAALAADRQQVGMDHLPPFDFAAHRDTPGPDVRWVPMREPDGGFRSYPVEIPPEQPEPAEAERQARAQLDAEEKAVARRLKALRRQEKEATAAADEAAVKAARIEEIHHHYLSHRRDLDREYQAGLAELRRAQRLVLEREGLTP